MNWLERMLNQEPDFVYTGDDALRDGVHQYIAEGVAVTDSVAALIPDRGERERLALELAGLYRAGVYSDPRAVWPEDFGPDFAAYRRDGREYYLQPAEKYLVLMLPEDY